MIDRESIPPDVMKAIELGVNKALADGHEPTEFFVWIDIGAEPKGQMFTHEELEALTQHEGTSAIFRRVFLDLLEQEPVENQVNILITNLAELDYQLGTISVEELEAIELN